MKHVVSFSDPRHGLPREIPLWLYRPAGFSPVSPVVIVMHGMSRNASAYLDAWMPYADQHGFAVAAPEFPKAHYPDARDYNFGNMLSPEGRLLSREQWLFPVIDRIFDHVRAALGSRRETYCLYGHSAGGQFVHRLVTFAWSPRIELAITANAGSYTLPVFEVAYPFGLAGTAFTEADFAGLFSRPLLILLGEQDNDAHHHHLPRQPEAMRQGAHRLARGRNYMEAATRAAHERRMVLAWRLDVVPGVTHSNPGMAAVAARFCAEAQGPIR